MTNILENDLANGLNDPRLMTDEEIECRVREDLVRDGHPEAATCSHHDLIHLIINRFNEIGEPLFPPGWRSNR